MEATAQEEQALREQLRQAREKVDELVSNLRAIDGELEGLATQREQYRVLAEVCGGLTALRELGAGALFWGERVEDARADDHVRQVQGRVAVFEGRLSQIEDRRQAVIEKIRSEEENTELIEDDLYEWERQEELRKLEWIVEREVEPEPARPSVMPWTRGGEDDVRLRKALAVALAVSLVLGLVLPLVELPLPERWKEIEVTDRLARLIREERPLPTPPPPVLQESKPEKKKEKETTPKKPEPTEEAPLLAEEGAGDPTPKESAASKGILAFREKFSGLAETKPSPRLGSQARISRAGEAAGALPQRSMVATQASGSSGGINLAALSRDVGGGGAGEQIEGVQVARATSSIGGGTGSDRPLSGGPGMARTDEEIQIVFDRHKAGLYRLYNRELRRDPTLKGQMVLRIRIEPDGSVSLCEVTSSDLDAPQLSLQVVGRVKTFDFGAKEGIPAITFLYPIDFLPAT